MAKERQQFSGVYRGTIVNNRDPKKQRRLQVEVTTSVGHYTDWVWPMEPANISTEVPEIGQGVWIHFQAADHEYPVWFGAFGKHQGKSKKLYVKALADSVSISTVTAYLKTIQQPDGTTEVDLMATLVAMANSLKDHETRIASLETQITQKANTSHSHPGL
jgi:hypothetical protein